MDGNVNRCVRRRRGVHGLEEHGAFVLIEELGGGVDVVVGPSIWATNHHDCHPAGGGGRSIDAIVVDGRLQELRVVLEPGRQG